MTQNNLKRSGCDCHDHGMPGLTIVEKLRNYRLEIKVKTMPVHFWVLLFSNLTEIFVRAISFKINGISD